MPKLLIVDDEVDTRDFAKAFFQKRGVEVLTAGNAKEALEVLKKVQPDLALFDVYMDDMNGVELLKEIRSQGNKLKVLMVTAVEDKEVVEEANKWGIEGYIHKPLVLEELETIVMAQLQAQ